MNSSTVTPSVSPGRIWIEWTLTLLGCLVLVGLVAGGPLTAPLSVHEEHHILESALQGPREWWRVQVHDVTTVGRVRPVYYGWHFLKIALFGARALPQHLLTMALGVLTAFALARAARAAGADPLSAGLFPALALFAGAQADIWYQVMSAAETIAMPFLALALWGLAWAARAPAPARLDRLWLAAALLAALAKESFVLVLPALLGLRVGLEALARDVSLGSALRARWRLLVVGNALGLALLVACLVVVKMLPHSYGSQAAHLGARSLDPWLWWATLRGEDVWPVVRLALAALPLLIFVAWRVPVVPRAVTCVLLAAAAGATYWLPQMVLYAGTMAQRYALPAVVAPAAIYAFTLSWLWRSRRGWARALFVLGCAWSLTSIGSGLLHTLQRATWWGAEARSTGAAVARLARELPADRALLIVVDPATGWGFESCFALPLFLRHAGFAGPIWLRPVRAPEAERSALHVPLAERVIAARSVYLHGDPARVGAAMIVTEPTTADALRGLVEQHGWRDIGQSEPLLRVVPRWPYLARGTFGRRVWLVGQPAAGFPPERPLVRITPALALEVGVNPLLDTPYGLEVLQGRTVTWLPPRESGMFEAVLWATVPVEVQVRVQASYGPARQGPRRTIEFQMGADPVQQATFEYGAVVPFRARLAAGANRLRVAALDLDDVPRQPGGDPRRCMVLLHDINVMRWKREGSAPPPAS